MRTMRKFLDILHGIGSYLPGLVDTDHGENKVGYKIT